MGFGRRLTRWALPALLAWQTAAGAAEPPAEPMLQIESGMHASSVRRVASDAKGQHLVTASEDKTLRLWDPRSGRLLKTLRVPIGPGEEGKLRAVAMSPDGTRIATGGKTGHSWDQSRVIYVLERDSGRMIRRITGLPEVINHMVWSPDGRYLAVTLFGKGGVWVYRMSDYTLAGSDTDYADSSYGAAFDGKGRLVTSSYDGQLRLYQVEAKGLRLLARKPAPAGKSPYGVAFSPDGKSIAVGDADIPYVAILAAESLAPRFEPNIDHVDNGDLARVVWSADGRFLYAGGSYSRDGRHRIIRWADGGRGSAQELPAGTDILLDMVPLPQGLAVGTGDPAFGVLDAKGEWRFFVKAAIADLRPDFRAFRLAPDGSEVSFAYEYWGSDLVSFSVPTRRFSAGMSEELRGTRFRAQGLDVEGWRNSDRPTLNGKPLEFAHLEYSRAMAFTPDGEGLVLGGDWYLYRFAGDGAQLWQRPVADVVWRINVSADGRLVVTSHGDGTIRWHRADDGRELLAFFPHPDRKRWLLWTPSGYYDAAPGAEALLGWHQNRGKEQAAEFIPASRLRARFYRPDVIDRVLETLDEAKAVELADKAAKGK